MNKYKNYLFFGSYLVTNPRLLKLTGKVYLPTYIQYEWLKKYKIGTVVDVGAFRGDVSRTLCFLFPRAKIYAFEPLKEHLQEIEAKVGGERLKPECAVVSDVGGVSEFYKNNYPQASSLLPLNRKAMSDRIFLSNTQKLLVKSVKLDDYFVGREIEDLLFIKIDVQGGEDKVIRGGRNFLKKAAFVHIETSFEPLYRNQPLWKEIYVLLNKLGFKYAGSLEDSDFYPVFGPKRRENSLFVNDKIIKSEKFFK